MNIIQRNNAVDIVRTAALFGICIVNLPFLGLNFNQQTGGNLNTLDQTTIFLVEALIQNKFLNILVPSQHSKICHVTITLTTKCLLNEQNI